jgi:cell wall-associated NlpC family hydrolase
VKHKAALAVGATPLTILALVITAGGAGGAHADARGIAGAPAQYVGVLMRAGQVCAEFTPSILAGQVDVETGGTWDPGLTSPAGAQGLSQFMPGTWAAHGLDGDGDGVADPWNGVDAIWSQANYDCQLAGIVRGYIADGTAQGSALDLALAAYNAGPGAVATYAGIPPYAETQNYVTEVQERAKKYATVASTNASASDVVARAQHYFGVPYVWGSAAPSGVDCSGLVWLVYHDLGTDLPVRTADQMANWSQASVISAADMQPGDLIAFRYPGAPTYHHIGIYSGTDAQGTRLMIHAPDIGGVVEQVSLDAPYWTSMEWRIVRF